MARGGINKVVVEKARRNLLARGVNPSIDAVRIELGNTGSKTTIARYLKELDEPLVAPTSQSERLSDELQALVQGLLARLQEEGNAAIEQAQTRFQQERDQLEQRIASLESEQQAQQRQLDAREAALSAQGAELLTCQSSLQAELVRNAGLAQRCSELELRLQERDQQIRSLEDKHSHARDALEHYRQASKEQREQEQRRHEAQLQTVQLEQRKLQENLVVRQDEATRLNRDNERLLADARQQMKKMAEQGDALQRVSGELQLLQMTLGRAEGAREQLQEQVQQLRGEAQALQQALSDARQGEQQAAAEQQRLLQDNRVLREQIAVQEQPVAPQAS